LNNIAGLDEASGGVEGVANWQRLYCWKCPADALSGGEILFMRADEGATRTRDM